MNDRRDNYFCIRPSAPKSRDQGFIAKVLELIVKATGGKFLLHYSAGSGAEQRPSSRLERGNTVARFAGAKLTHM